MITFQHVAMLLAAVCIALGVLWLADPASYAALYSVDIDHAGGFLGRRAAPVLIALGVLFYMARHEPPSPLRRVLCLASAFAFIGVACTGVWAYFDGTATIAVVVAAVSEVVIAGLVLKVAQER